MYERGSFAIPYVIGLLVGGLNGYNIGHGLGVDSAENHADVRVQQVQTENEQIRQELTGTHRLIARLVLNDGEKTFSFQSANDQNQPETCTGHYQLKNETATAVGNLACTLMVPVTR